MATAYRSSANVTNGTAGTTVVVAKPAGIVDTGANPARDQLIAFIAAEGGPTVSAPAGWTLVTSAVDAGNAVALWCYRKLASSEGASWTWTLGTSHRNWGWVGAYAGVDPTTPVASTRTDLTLTSSTILATGDSTATFPANGQGVSAGAAVRAASGSATTWTHSGTERADLSTNAGAGTDVAGEVGDSVNATFVDSLYVPTLTASQSQSAGVAIGIALAPYSVPYTGARNATGLVLETALGVDPDSDSSTWTWTDVSAFLHNPAQLRLTHGRSNRASLADPMRMEFTLLNLDGEWTSPTGTYTASVVRNLPFRVRLTGFGTGNYHRGTAFLASMRPRWDPSTKVSVVDVVAQGRLRRIQQRVAPLRSAGYRSVYGIGQPSFTPAAYWSFEDGSTATKAASAIAGGSPASTAGVTFGADSSYPGSAALATLSASSVITGAIPTYVATGQWVATWALAIPSEPAATTSLLEVYTTGTAARWVLELQVGTSALHVRAYDSTGASILDDAVAVTESDFYGAKTLFSVGVTQSGADINYAVWAYVPGSGTGVAGTLAGFTHGNATRWRLPPQAGLANGVFGHLAVYTNASFDPDGDTFTLAEAINSGHAGDLPWSRFQRLCIEENVPYNMDQSDNLDLTMGPQGVASLMTLLRECETVEGCVLNDSGSLGQATGVLWFPAADDRQNITASLTLAVADGEVATFEPTFDDQDIVNDVETTRSTGSFAHVIDAASVLAEGNYNEQVAVNTLDDTFLADLAGWRVHLGTVTGMRFPGVMLNLRRATSLAATWADTALFSRVDITRPPSQYPPDDITSVLEGYVETLSAETWTAALYLSPYKPYAVGTLASASGDTSDLLGWLDWDACVLTANAAAGATSWTVAAFPTDTTTADDLPRQQYCGLELVTTTASAKAVADTFTRSTSNGWGSADTGQAWTTSGGAASDYSTNGTQGVHAHTAANSLHCTYIETAYTDQAVQVDTLIPFASATGASIGAWGAVRLLDTNNYYFSRLTVTTAGAVTLELLKRVAGTLTTLASAITLSTTHSASDTYRLVTQIYGTTLTAKAWKTTATEPGVWQLTATDSSLTTGTQAACLTRFETGNTDVSRNVKWDNFDVLSARTWTVTRSVNHVSKAQTAGSTITLAKPIVLTM